MRAAKERKDRKNLKAQSLGFVFFAFFRGKKSYCNFTGILKTRK